MLFLCLFVTLSVNSQVLEDYTLFSTQGTYIGERGIVKGGLAGSNTYIECGNDADIYSTIVAAGNTLLKDRVKVIGNISLSGTLSRLSQTYVSGIITENTPVGTITIPLKSFFYGTLNYTVANGQSLTLPPGSYNTLHAFSNATINLSSGTYNFREFKTEPDVDIIVDTTGGPVFINIKQNLSLADRNSILIDSQSNPLDVKIYAHQITPIRIGTDSRINACFSAPRTQLTITSRTIINGRIEAKLIILESDTTISYASIPDTDNDSIPDFIEEEIGTDPADAGDPAVFAKPDDWKNTPDQDQIVAYKLPFPFWQSELRPWDYTMMTIPAGSLATSYNPVITFIDTEKEAFPEIPMAANEELLGAYKIYGALNPGASLEMAFPFMPVPPRLIGTNTLNLAYYDESAGSWVKIPVSKTTDNAAFALLLEIQTEYYLTAMNNIILVKQDAPAGGSGRDRWENAVQTLTDALAIANPDDEIWVSAGIYVPTTGTDQTARFQIPANVTLLGGFRGYEMLPKYRDWEANPTILSGDIGVPEDYDDNCYTVIQGANNVILDGFTITRAVDLNLGGGLEGGIVMNGVTNMTVRNCRIDNNAHLHSGSGISIYNSTNCTVEDSSLYGNTAHYNSSSGAMLIVNSSGISITGVAFQTNLGGAGGCIYAHAASNLLVRNCLAAENYGLYSGGVALMSGNTATIQNCTFANNTAGISIGSLYCDTDTNTVEIRNSILRNYADATSYYPEIWPRGSAVTSTNSNIHRSNGSGADWDTFLGTDGGGNIDADPLFADITNTRGPDDIIKTMDDGLRIQGTNSPCYNTGTGTSSEDILGQTISHTPDMGAYWVTLSENPGYSVDFLDHEDNSWGFDKVAFDSGEPDPDLIYVNIPENGESVVNVVVQNPTGMYIRSSNTSVFQIQGASSNRLDLDRNVTRVALSGGTSTATHRSALLEVCNSADTVVRSLNVEVYDLVSIPEIYYYRLIDTGSPDTSTELLNPPGYAIQTELNKAFNQAVINTDAIVANQNMDVGYDVNLNGILDVYPGAISNPELDIYLAAPYQGTYKFCFVQSCRMNWRITSQANEGSTTMYVESTTYMDLNGTYPALAANGNTEDITIIDINPSGDGFVITLQSPLVNSYQANDVVFCGVGGFAYDPQIIVSYYRIFLILAHELLHSIGGFGDLNAPDNIMNYITESDCTKLRYRAQEFHYSVGTEEQWNQVPRE